MPAHAEQADVVEEDDASGTRRVFWLHEQGTDDHLMPAWLANDRTTMRFELRGADATQNDACGLAAGVGVDDGNAFHEPSSVPEGRKAILADSGSAFVKTLKARCSRFGVMEALRAR
jgi:hypothetical protein